MRPVVPVPGYTGPVTPFATTRRPDRATAIAPDGSAVRVLLGLSGGGMAEFELGPGQIAAAVTHRTVEEIWYVLQGRGEMWRRQGSEEQVIALEPGVCLTIPPGVHFQYRALGEGALRVLGVTMPPWPGADEASVVAGPWTPNPSAR
jgi:mannose-6-phosphate isomerase-like protein (cupin superfamily)